MKFKCCPFYLFHGDLPPPPPGFCSLSGITASSESLIFDADGAGEGDDEVVSSGDYGIDGNAPWYLRVQELAHDSLIAATRAQIARDAKASQDARAASVSNGKVPCFFIDTWKIAATRPRVVLKPLRMRPDGKK